MKIRATHHIQHRYLIIALCQAQQLDQCCFYRGFHLVINVTLCRDRVELRQLSFAIVISLFSGLSSYPHFPSSGVLSYFRLLKSLQYAGECRLQFCVLFALYY